METVTRRIEAQGRIVKKCNLRSRYLCVIESESWLVPVFGNEKKESCINYVAKDRKVNEWSL